MDSMAVSPSINLSQIPNPTTDLAWLDPATGYQIQVARYILVGAVSVFIWDILFALREDYYLLFKLRFNIPTGVYFISRIFSFTYCFLSTIFETTPVGHCFALIRVLCILYPIATSSTSLLFFFRVRAVFAREKYVVWAFFALWLGVLGSNLTITNAVTAAFLGPTKYCVNASIRQYAFVAITFVCIHDFFVFVAISYRMVSNAHIGSGRTLDSMKSFIKGDYLPDVSKMILQDGQIYFAFTVGVNIVATVLCYLSSLPPTYRTMLTVPNIVLTHCMAGKIFRHTKLAFARDQLIITSSSFAGGAGVGGTNAPSIPLAVRRTGGNTGGLHGPTQVTITQSVTQDFDRYGSENAKTEEYPSYSDRTIHDIHP